MARANRYRTAGQVWHITQRCHRKQFLLKFARDRRWWVRWLYEARKRFGLCVLDYQVTSNHAHLLVVDRGGDEIAAEEVKRELAGRARYRRIVEDDGESVLRDRDEAYGIISGFGVEMVCLNAIVEAR